MSNEETHAPREDYQDGKDMYIQTTRRMLEAGSNKVWHSSQLGWDARRVQRFKQEIAPKLTSRSYSGWDNPNKESKETS